MPNEHRSPHLLASTLELNCDNGIKLVSPQLPRQDGGGGCSGQACRALDLASKFVDSLTGGTVGCL